MHVFVCNGYIERRGTRYRPEFEHDHTAVDGFPECDCECGRTFSQPYAKVGK